MAGTYTPQQFGGFTLPGGYQGNVLNVLTDPLAFNQRQAQRTVGFLQDPMGTVDANLQRAQATAQTALAQSMLNRQSSTTPSGGGGWGDGAVLGEGDTGTQSTGSNVQTFSPRTGGGSYQQGPSAYEQQLAAEKAALMEQQKQQGFQFADQAYNDMIANLNNQEGQVKNMQTGGADYINQLRNSNVSDITNQGDLSKRQARQSYQDSILQTRIRARALGGAASSGFMDLTSRLDQALAGNLTNIDTTNMSAMNKVKLTADKALTDLQMEMDKNLNEIANQKNLSLRERDKAKAQIQMEAAQGALEIKSWLDGKIKTVSSSGPSVASQAAEYKANLIKQFGQDIGGIQSSNISANPQFQSQMQRYTPAFISAGIDPKTISGYYTPEPTQQEIMQSLFDQSNAKKRGELDAINAYNAQ